MTLSLVIDRLSTRRLARSGAGSRTDESFEQGFQRGFERGLSYYETLARGGDQRRAGALSAVASERALRELDPGEPRRGPSAGSSGDAYFIEERSGAGVSLSLWARAQPVAAPGGRGLEMGVAYELRAQNDRLSRVYEADAELARRALAAGGSAICQALYLDAELAERVGQDFAAELSAAAAAPKATGSQQGLGSALSVAAAEPGEAFGPAPIYFEGELEEPEWASGR